MTDPREITKIARETQKLHQLVLKDTSIGSSELDVIHYVRHHPGTSQSEVVEGLHSEKGAIAKRVLSLQKKGYLERKTDSHDKRRHLLYPTEKAQSLKQSKTETESTFYAWLLEDLSEEEKRAFLNTLDTVYRKSKKESRAGFPHILERLKKL